MDGIQYFTNRLQCFVQGKMEAMVTVKKVCGYARILYERGLLELEDALVNEKDPFLKKGLLQVVACESPDTILRWMSSRIQAEKSTSHRFLEMAVIIEGIEGMLAGLRSTQIASMLEGWFGISFISTYREQMDLLFASWSREEVLVPFFARLESLDDEDLKRLCRYSDAHTMLASLMDSKCSQLQERVLLLLRVEDPWRKKQVEFQEAVGIYKPHKGEPYKPWKEIQKELEAGISEEEIRTAQTKVLNTARTLGAQNRLKAIPYQEKTTIFDEYRLWGEELMDQDYIDMAYYTQRLQCSQEDKMACLETVRKLYWYGIKTRMDGFLAVEAELEKETDVFLKKGMMCLVDYMNKRLTRKTLTNYLISEDIQGKEFLNKVLVIEGIGMIQEGVNPRFMLELLEGWFGSDFAPTFEQEILKMEEETRQQAIQRTEEDLKDREDKDTSIWIGFDSLRALVDVEIQRLLRDVDTKDLAVSLKGAAQDVAELLLNNLSPKMKETITMETNRLTHLRARDVEDAQKKIIRIAEMLDKAGEIALVRIDIK